MFHTGGISTYISLLQLLPAARAGVFLSTSGPGGNAGGLLNTVISAYISDKLLGKEPWLNATTACSSPQPWVQKPGGNEAKADKASKANKAGQGPEVPLSAVDLAGLSPSEVYTGNYGHMAFDVIKVYMEGESLFALFGRFGKLRMEPQEEVGAYSVSFVDKLWYLSHEDMSPVMLTVHFSAISDGKTQELWVMLDLAAGMSKFERDLDVSVVPPHEREVPEIYRCSDDRTGTSGVVSSNQDVSVLTIASSLMIGICLRVLLTQQK